MGKRGVFHTVEEGSRKSMQIREWLCIIFSAYRDYCRGAYGLGLWWLRDIEK